MTTPISQARRILAMALGVQEGEIGNDASFWNIDSWDSLNHVGVVVAIEQKLGRRLDDIEAGSVVDFDSVVRLLSDAPPGAADYVNAITDDIAAIDVPLDSVVLMHSSWAEVGAAAGTPHGFLTALIRRLTEVRATLVLPAMSGRLQRRRFDPESTASEEMGVLPEVFRRMPGVLRSPHPVSSFSAIGPRAAEIVTEHPLDCPTGLAGPVGKMYVLDTWILLLGVDHESNTAIHLAEHLQQVPYIDLIPLTVVADSELTGYMLDVAHCDRTTFAAVGAMLLQNGLTHQFYIGGAMCELMRLVDVVDSARTLLRADPLAFLCRRSDCARCREIQSTSFDRMRNPPPRIR